MDNMKVSKEQLTAMFAKNIINEELAKLGFIYYYEDENAVAFMNENCDVIHFTKARNYGVCAFNPIGDKIKFLGFEIPELKAIHSFLESRGVI